MSDASSSHATPAHDLTGISPVCGTVPPAGATPPVDVSLVNRVEAINKIAEAARTIFLSLMTISVALGGVLYAATDEALFRDTSNILPFVGITLKLSTAFALIPPVYVFIHVNGLMQLHLLYCRWRALEEALEQAAPQDNAQRQKIFALLHGFAYLQLLAERHGLIARQVTRFMVFMATAFIPLLVLVLLQLSFLRYQESGISFVHRCVIWVDAISLLSFYGMTILPPTSSPWSRGWFWGRWSVGLVGLGLLLWLISVHAVPLDPKDAESLQEWGLKDPTASVDGKSIEEDMYRTALPWRKNWPQAEARKPLTSTDAWEFLRATVLFRVEGDHQPVLVDWLCDVTNKKGGGIRWRWVCRSLDLNNLSLINYDRRPDVLQPFVTDSIKRNTLQQQILRLDVRGRHFHLANFSRAQLFSANLSDVKAMRSVWSVSELSGVAMGGAVLTGADFQGATLSGADLYDATLNETALQRAILTGADLRKARLKGADLQNAMLVGANLRDASLLGADVRLVNLSGAKLLRTDLRGAMMRGAALNGADLTLARVGWTEGKLSPEGKCLFVAPPPPEPVSSEKDDAELAFLRKVWQQRGEDIAQKWKSRSIAQCGELPLIEVQADLFKDVIPLRVAVACADPDAAQGIWLSSGGEPHRSTTPTGDAIVAAKNDRRADGTPRCPGLQIPYIPDTLPITVLGKEN